MTGYVACCCDPGFEIRIRSTLSLDWTSTIISFGETSRADHFVGNQTLDVKGRFTQSESEVWDMGSSVSRDRFSFGTIAETIDGFVDLNEIGPGGARRIPASLPIFFPGLSFWTVGIGDASDCLDLENGTIYARASLFGIATPSGGFDNGSAGWSRTLYDFNGNPTGSDIRRGTPIQGLSGGTVQVPMINDVSRAYRVLNDFPSSDVDFVEDLGVFDPTPDAYTNLPSNPTNVSLWPEFDLSLDGISYSREQVETRDPELLCALRRCTEVHVRYQFEENANTTVFGDFLTTRDSEIIEYAVV